MTVKVQVGVNMKVYGILVYLSPCFFHKALLCYFYFSRYLLLFLPLLNCFVFRPIFFLPLFWKDIAAYRAKGKPDAAKKGVVKAEKSKKKKEEEEDEEDEEDEEEEDEEEDEEEEEDDDDE